MGCCGNQRRAWRAEPPRTQGPVANPPRPVYFRYVGNASLTVTGPVTGNTYIFSGAGSATAIDPRDAPSLASVPRLSRIR